MQQIQNYPQTRKAPIISMRQYSDQYVDQTLEMFIESFSTSNPLYIGLQLPIDMLKQALSVQLCDSRFFEDSIVIIDKHTNQVLAASVLIDIAYFCKKEDRKLHSDSRVALKQTLCQQMIDEYVERLIAKGKIQRTNESDPSYFGNIKPGQYFYHSRTCVKNSISGAGVGKLLLSGILNKGRDKGYKGGFSIVANKRMGQMLEMMKVIPNDIKLDLKKIQFNGENIWKNNDFGLQIYATDYQNVPKL